MKRKYIKIAMVVCAIALALPVFSVLAHTWTTTDLIHFFEHGDGRRWLKRTNVRVIKILDTVREIRELMGQGLVGEVDPEGTGEWTTTGTGWSESYSYSPPEHFSHPKKFSFWINLWYMGSADTIEITVLVETEPGIEDPYDYQTYIGNVDPSSILVVDQLPLAGNIVITIAQTAGNPFSIDYHAIIEEN